MKKLMTALSLAAAVHAAKAGTPLENALLAAVRDAHFENVLDFGAGNEGTPVATMHGDPAKKIAHPPNVNVAVLQLDAQGNLIDRAYVILSRDYPDGLIVPLDKNLDPNTVRFLRWDIDRSNGGTFAGDGKQTGVKGWTDNPPLTPADDLVSNRADAPITFAVPYPASLFKSMVAFHVMRMIDAGKISLDSDYAYAPPDTKPDTRKIRDWLEAMLTVSDNHATQALLKMFHDRNEDRAAQPGISPVEPANLADQQDRSPDRSRLGHRADQPHRLGYRADVLADQRRRGQILERYERKAHRYQYHFPMPHGHS